MHRCSREVVRRRWLSSSSSSFSSKPIPTTEIQTQPSQKINTHDHQLEIANAIRPSYQSQTPLLIPKLISKCDAIYFWRSLDYWRAAVPNNIPVDVELGSYNSGNKVSMEFGDYLNYLSKSIEEEQQQQHHHKRTEEPDHVAYLAQNELFAEVKRDVPIPHFCSEESFNVGEGKLYHSMLWLGPRNTVSPLHYDPLDNLLMQIVGKKRVLLYPPDKSNASDNNPWHYAGFNGNQYNTSDVDVEHPNLEKHPNFQTAPTPFECVIGPGDVLFIPAKWWHHVRSLSWSASANVWWR